MESVSPRDLLRHRLQTRKLLVRNYLAHAVEGGLYSGGLAFLADTTILPVMIVSLHGPVWLLSAIPILSGIGFQIPPLLVAHWIEKLHWVKPLVMTTGVFQRIPYLLTGLALLYLAPSHPSLALAAVALCPLISGLISGLSQSAWYELVAKTIPENRRASLWAVRSIIAAAIGTAGGHYVHTVLEQYPGTAGYGRLFLVATAFLAGSFIVFSLIRETHLPARPGPQTPTLLANLKAVPALVAGNRGFRQFVAAQAMASGLVIVLPFLSIHALAVLHEDYSFVGILLSAQMIGGAVGNVVGGLLGDRIGGKIILLLARVSLVVTCAAMALATQTWEFLAAFALFGTASSLANVGYGTLGLEVCPLQKRATFLAVLAAVSVVTSLAASGLGGLAWKLTSPASPGSENPGQFACVAVAAAIALAGSALMIWRLEEPRRRFAVEVDSQVGSPEE